MGLVPLVVSRVGVVVVEVPQRTRERGGAVLGGWARVWHSTCSGASAGWVLKTVGGHRQRSGDSGSGSGSGGCCCL